MEKIVMKNGLTVALEYKPSVHSAAVSIYVAAGNRFEEVDSCGMSHFIEHMVFKGTHNRSSEMIAREADMMGGQLNAYTAKEYTCFYSRALSEHLPKTLSLMCDMLCNPKFDEQDIETEKGVVLEEIGMYEDSLEDLCSDMLNSLCYRNRPLGYNILGTRKSVSEFTADGLRRYMNKLYVPERIVVSLCGNFEKSQVLEILEQYFGEMDNTNNPLTFDKFGINGGVTLFQQKASEAQVAFCFNGLEAGHELRYAASFYSSILGGAASSKINRRIREELGLAYSVYSFSSSYLGTGVFGISAGLANKNQERFFKETAEIINASRFNITADDINMTREQFKAGIVLSNESMSAVSSSMGRQLLLEGRYVDLDSVLQEVNNVTAEQVREAARLVTDSKTVALSAVGEICDESFYKKAISNL